MPRKSKIPLVDCVITAHKCPDGDALSSCRAVYNYLINNGKRAAIKLKGGIPKNLRWILDGVELVDEIPEWTKLIIVLDSEPSYGRLGWSLPKQIPVFNIDHHAYRLAEHDPSKKIFIIDTFSTAEILFRKFGIRDDILVVGAYTDTYFAKSVKDAFTFILDLEVSEEKIEEYLNKINFRSDKRTWRIIRDSKIHRCKNGFLIVETLEDDPAAVEGAMHVLCELNDTVCLIYGDKQVKLRTSNKELDLSKIAKHFGGGGHSFASGCNIESITEFKDFIIHYEEGTSNENI